MIQDLIERLAAVLRTRDRKVANLHGLQPVHLEMLRYLAKANRLSDTPTAVAEFLGATPGTISQSLQVLERGGFVARRPDPEDRRRVHLAPTESGHALITASSWPELDNLGSDLGPPLATVLLNLQRDRGGRPFGTCRLCRFHRHHDGRSRCELTGFELAPFEWAQLCREFEPPTVSELDPGR